VPDLASLTLFFVAAVALLVTPGPAVLYIVARSVDQGWKAGFMSSLGISVGSLVQLLAAAFGLSAIVLSSVVAFAVIKYLGAAYLVWLGIQKLRARDNGAAGPRVGRDSMRRIFSQGIVVNLLNPKSALFLVAFLPQFVDVAKGHVAVQIIALGLIFIAMGIASDSVYALAAGSVAGRLRRNHGLMRRQRYFAGGLYILLGLTAAFAGSGRQK
jgi:threonine/homoserine/homoserine lactone efflux protein